MAMVRWEPNNGYGTGLTRFLLSLSLTYSRREIRASASSSAHVHKEGEACDNELRKDIPRLIHGTCLPLPAADLLGLQDPPGETFHVGPDEKKRGEKKRKNGVTAAATTAAKWEQVFSGGHGQQAACKCTRIIKWCILEGE